MDSMTENYMEKWNAMRKGYEAKAERLSAENRLKYNVAFENFSEEVSAITDWTEAAWDEFTAKVDKKWQELAISIQE